MKRISFVDLKKINMRYEIGFRKDLKNVLRSSNLVLGEAVKVFEQGFAETMSPRPFVVGVGNGTDAIEIALRSLGLESGYEVLVPNNSFIASAIGVLRAGGVPVFVDCNDRYEIDFDSAARQLTTDTKVIMPVHLYGSACDFMVLKDFASTHNLRIVEDCAQAHGLIQNSVSAGTVGDVAAMSFYPGKNLGALGDAGAVITTDPKIADSARKIRNLGGIEKYDHSEYGFNSRLDPLQARFLTRKLEGMEKATANRRLIAGTYLSEISSSDKIILPPQKTDESVWHLFVIRSNRRDELASFLNSRGIQTGIHYPKAICENRPFQKFSVDPKSSLAQKFSRQVLSLPIHGTMKVKEAKAVSAAINDWSKSR